MSQAPARYRMPAIALHWIMALLIAGLFAVGLYMHGLALSPWKLRVFSWHKWAGVTVFLLLLLRLAWRSTNPAPPLPPSMPAPLRLMALGAHGLLYLLMAAIPISGWLMSSAKGFQTVYFAILPLPDLVAKDKVLGEQLFAVHQWLNFLLASLVAGHAAAALKHHFVDRDDVLARMLPARLLPREGRATRRPARHEETRV